MVSKKYLIYLQTVQNTPDKDTQYKCKTNPLKVWFIPLRFFKPPKCYFFYYWKLHKKSLDSTTKEALGEI